MPLHFLAGCDKILKNRTIEYKQDDSLGALRSEGGIG